MYIIGGTHKKRNLLTPPGEQTRPSSAILRAALFNICQQEIEGATFLDLYAGSGAMGLEALSRGARYATFVDSQRVCVTTIQKNIDKLALEDHSIVFMADAYKSIEKLSKQGKTFDIIFADPPYYIESSLKLLQAIDSAAIVADDGSLFLEEAYQKTVDVKTIPLNHLVWISSRRFGHSSLHHFRRQT